MTYRKTFAAAILAAVVTAVGAIAGFGQGALPPVLSTLAGTEYLASVNSTLGNVFTTTTVKKFVNSAASGQSIAANLVHTGGWKPLAITDGTEVTCVATTTYVAQVYIPANMTVTGVAIVNATAVAGNVTVGLADSTGAPITAAQSASTAASGTAAYQRIPFASPYSATGPGTYYIQLQCDNTGDKFRAHTVGDFRTTSQTSGTYGTLVSFTPPTTFTTAVGPVASLY